MNHRVVWLENNQTFQVEPGEAVLAAAKRHLIKLPYECEYGGCGTCRIQLVEGSVSYVSEDNESGELPMGLSPEEAEAGYALACQARCGSDLVISVAPPLACSDPTLVNATVESVHILTPEVTHLRLRLPDDVSLIYQPGQYMNVQLNDGRHRSFSMASNLNGGAVDFHIRRIPGGHFTDGQVGKLCVGQALQVEMPHGNFCFHPKDDRPILMVATGTGLAPIKSILEALMDSDDCPPVSLYWGMRSEEDLYLHAEIQTWAGRLHDFQYVPVLSRPHDLWTGRRGYVQDAIVDDVPELSEHAIYLCGSPNMIRDAKTAFLKRGASLDHIYSDSFEFQTT